MDEFEQCFYDKPIVSAKRCPACLAPSRHDGGHQLILITRIAMESPGVDVLILKVDGSKWSSIPTASI